MPVTDMFSIVCILPFPALLKVTEPRLRLAVCAVYSLAIVAIIVSLIRVVLLATDVQNSIKRIMVLTTIEATVCIIIGILPGISSAFTSKYVQSGPGSSKLASWSKGGKQSGQVFSQLKDNNIDAIEFSQLSRRAVVSADQRSEYNSFAESTHQIIAIAPEGITKVTHISVATEKR